MSFSTLVRLCGLALIASSVLFLISILGQSSLLGQGVSFDPNNSYVLYNLTSFIDVLVAPLEVLGLIGLYARRPQATGIFGLVAFSIAFSGGMLMAGYTWYTRFVEWVLPFDVQVALMLQMEHFPEVSGPYALGSTFVFPLYLLGWLLMGTAFLRAGLYPRWAVMLLIAISLAAGILDVFSSLVGVPDVGSRLPYAVEAGGVLQNAVLAWLGFVLWLGRKDPGDSSGVPAASRALS